MSQALTSSTRPEVRIRRGLARLASVLTASLLIGVGSLAFAAPAHAAPTPVSGIVDDMTFEADASNVAAGATLTDYAPGAHAVTIPATVTINTVTYNVTAIGNSAFAGDFLTAVTIPNTVTTIGDHAFAVNDLTAVTIPNTVTTIGEQAFFVNDLTAVTIPDSVTTIGPGAFMINQITQLNLGSGVTEIAPVAFGYNLLTEFTIPDSVTTIGDLAFFYNHLQTVTVGSSVTSIGAAAFSANYPYDLANPGLSQFTAENATLKTVTFTGAAPTTITDITGVGNPVNASFGPFDVLVSYPWAFGTDNGVADGFTSPTWQGYASQAIATVDFELNGHGTAIDSQAITVGSVATEPAAPSASGFTFTGWFTDAALTNAFSFSTEITADTTLYAGWTTPPADTVDVNFEMNGHGTQIPSQTVTVGELATEPTAPTASGFTFTGWFTDAEATDAFDFDTALSGNVTLYADWTTNLVPPVTAVTVSFDLNGHGTPIASQTVTVGDLATKPTAPSASGFTFTGWYADASLATTFDFSTPVTAPTTVYAGWKQNAVVVPPTTTPPVTPVTPVATLAATGTSTLTIPLVAALAALFAGGGLLIRRRRIRNP
ncbi:hypothetical protein GCM10022381_17420 [Leifsonia kafniensis]|uniref:Gram-positive cocci surface proteins LPxTG domain-containing protein n=1 Tax=Leifsonia kafniensis TaxID=475957 RepID=A0ABP7KHA3_9MICO